MYRFASPARTCAAVKSVTLCLLICACQSQEEKNLLVVMQQNSKLFYDQGDYARAVATCRKGLELDSDNRTLRLTLAYSLLQTAGEGDVREADRIFEELDSWSSSDFRVLLGRGITQLNLSRMIDDPDSAEEYRHRARSFFEESIELEPDNSEAIFQLAVLDLEQKALEDFDRHSDRAIELIKSSARIKRRTLDRVENPEQQRRIQRDLAVDLRRGQELLRLRAELAFREEHYEKALADLNAMEELGVLARSDFFNRARTLEGLGKLEEAVAQYDQFLRLSRDGTDDNVQLAVEKLYELRAKLAEERVMRELGES